MRYVIAPNGRIVLPPEPIDYVLIAADVVISTLYIGMAVTVADIGPSFFFGLILFAALTRYRVRFIHRIIPWRELTRGEP